MRVDVQLLAFAIFLGAAPHISPSSVVVGAWRWMGTAPAGFMRQGVQEAQVTLSLRQDHLQGLVVTGPHRYTSSASYAAKQQQLQFTLRTAQGSVRIQATLLKGNQRMIGTWYDAHGDDGGFVLVRIAPAASHHRSSP